MNDDKTVPMGGSPWPDDEEDQKRTVVDGDDKTVPMGDAGDWGRGQQPTPNAGGWGPTVADDTPAPFQQTNPQDRPTPTGPGKQGGWGDYPRYESPPPQRQPWQGGGSGEGKTQIMAPSGGVSEKIPLAWLAVVEGPGAPRGEVFRLGADTVLGRTRDNHIALSGDRAVSSRHLKIKLETGEEDPGQKFFVMYDQGSSNGTFVGDYETCKAAENRAYRHVLEDGDFLLIGETILVFKSVEMV